MAKKKGKRKDVQKRLAKRAARQEKQREERAKAAGVQQAAPGPRTFKNPDELFTAVLGDIVNLMSTEQQLKLIIDMRLKEANELKEKNPLKFNDLRVDELLKLKEELEPVHELVGQLASWIGMLNDLETAQAKMESLHENMGLVFETQSKFNVVSKKMQEVDAKFNASIGRPAVTPDNEDLVTETSSATEDTSSSVNSDELTAPPEDMQDQPLQPMPQVAPEQ